VGDDSFTYRTTDGREDSGLAVVTIEVLPLDGGSSGTGSDNDSQEDQTDESQDEESSDSETAAIDETAPPALPEDTQQPNRTGPLYGGAQQFIGAAHLPDTDEVLPDAANETVSLVATNAYSHTFDSRSDIARQSGLGRDVNRNTPESAASDRDVVQREYGTLWNQLDTLAQDVREDVESRQTFESFVVGTTAISVTGLTVGYVLWLIRGGTLLASLISSLPAWCAFDPLPVLDNFDTSEDRRRDRDDISFESLVAGRDQNPRSAQATTC
jgi:hypothetical protein